MNSARRPNGAVEDVLIAIIDCHAQQHDEAREIDAWVIAGHGETEAKPRAMAKAPPAQITALKRGVATLKALPLFDQCGPGLVSGTLAPGVPPFPWPTTGDPGFPAFRAALVAAQRPWHAVEQQMLAAAVVAKADAFYREVRSAYPTRAELEADLAQWPAWPNIEESGQPGEVRHLDATFAPPPKKLWPAWNAAKPLPDDFKLRELPRERGHRSKRGGWPGNVRIEVLIAGHHRQTMRAIGHQTRVARVDLLAPSLLAALYGPGRRVGPKAAAQEFTAGLICRSPSQVENLVHGGARRKYPRRPSRSNTGRRL